MRGRKWFQCLLPGILMCAFSSFASTPSSGKPILSMEQAKKIALARHSGQVKSSVLEREHGRLIYSFDIERDNETHEGGVEATTGRVVEDKIESAEAEARERRQEKKARPKTQRGPDPIPKNRQNSSNHEK